MKKDQISPVSALLMLMGLASLSPYTALGGAILGANGAVLGLNGAVLGANGLLFSQGELYSKGASLAKGAALSPGAAMNPNASRALALMAIASRPIAKQHTDSLSPN